MSLVTANPRFRTVLIGFLSLFALAVWMPQFSDLTTDCDCLEVSFLDVGQGDAILLRTPSGIEVLIDGGKGSAVLRSMAAVRPFGDRSIDLMIATHPDLDHIGGLSDVLHRYQVGLLITTSNLNPTAASTALTTAVAAEGMMERLAEAGEVIVLDDEVYLQVLSPVGDETNWESNTASIVLRVVYGETAFMLTGDAPASIEDTLVERYGSQLTSQVLKLGHHGSKTSTSETFLDAVAPKYAVVSAGADNSYGHPAGEVLARVIERDIALSQTAIDGTITFISDGQTVWRE